MVNLLEKKKEYFDDELENLNWEEKFRLIQCDPVTCVRNFVNKINQFLATFSLVMQHHK